ELQQVYWGGRLADTDTIPQPQPMREAASFDSSYTTTPEEYAGWGSGLFVEPALKVTFADGNRDLVLHYESHTVKPDGVDVVLKDISRKVLVTLHYSIDAGSGIVARSATIENREAQPVTVEQAQLDAVRVTGGFNPFDFGYVLAPGQSLETPVFYGGYSNHGLGGASRLLHHFEIDHVLPHRPGQQDSPKPRPVIYNSWE